MRASWPATSRPSSRAKASVSASESWGWDPDAQAVVAVTSEIVERVAPIQDVDTTIYEFEGVTVRVGYPDASRRTFEFDDGAVQILLTCSGDAAGLDCTQ